MGVEVSLGDSICGGEYSCGVLRDDFLEPCWFVTSRESFLAFDGTGGSGGGTCGLVGELGW